MARYTVLLYPEPEDGGYSVLVPLLGTATQGETVEEALAMARDAIEGVLAVMRERGEDIPEEDLPPIVASVEVPVLIPAEVATA
jgi:antitoxin HicB